MFRYDPLLWEFSVPFLKQCLEQTAFCNTQEDCRIEIIAHMMGGEI
jgi:esterase/lipase superfamily enzyme